jgi:hypothetical protein
MWARLADGLREARVHRNMCTLNDLCRQYRALPHLAIRLLLALFEEAVKKLIFTAGRTDGTVRPMPMMAVLRFVRAMEASWVHRRPGSLVGPGRRCRE